MKKRVYLDDQMMETAILLKEKGITNVKISEILGIGDSTVKNIWGTWNAAQNNNIATLRKMSKASRPITEWACRKAGIDISALDAPEPEPEQKAPEKSEKLDNTAMAFTALLESIKELTAAVNSIDKRLSAMQLTQQGFRGDMADRIGKAIEAVNVNGDILTKEHDRMIDLLGGIKQNTKRRYQNQEG